MSQSVTALGLRAAKGASIAVALYVDADGPQMLFSGTLATGLDDDQLSLAPYGVATEMAKGGALHAEIVAAVAEGRRRQDEIANQSLQDIVGRLDARASRSVVAALLVNRAGWVSDVLEYSLGWPDHVPVAEGLAVRDALRFAVRQSGIELAELDEKSLYDQAGQVLGLQLADIDAHLKRLGESAGKPWRKEQKLAALAAWMALGIRS